MKRQIYNFLLPFLFSLAAIFLWSTAATTSLATARPGFALHSRTLVVDDVATYKIIRLEKKQSVLFSCSNTNLAAIHQQTGQLTAKKPGTVTISAKICNQNGKKIRTIKTKLIILKKRILPNASFQVKGEINPWNFQIHLSCNRILLEKEVEESSLNIISKANKKKKISAAFYNLSTDGREITYTIPDDSQKILCPGDTSMNGTYEITSSIFSKKLSISYEERIAADTVSGFILQNNGNPVQDALVRINTVSSGIMETTTNNAGHYQMKNVKNPSSMSVSKDGYQTQSLPLSSSQKGVLCENFILKKNSNTTALECIVTDENDIGIPDAAVTLAFEKSDSFLCQAATDENGKVIFDNASTDNLQQTDCSIIYPNAEEQLSYVSPYSFSSKNRHTVNFGQLSPENPVTVYVTKNYMDFDSPIHYETQKYQISFPHLMSNYASLRICLKEITYRPLQSLSVKWNSSDSPADCHKVSLSLYHQTQKKPVFQRLLLANEFSMGTMQKSQNTILTILAESAYPTLPDGDFLISLSAFNSENTLLAESGLLPCYLENGCLYISSGSSSPAEKNEEQKPEKEKLVIPLQTPRSIRILLYTDSLDIPDSRISASFHIYQKKDGQYYFLKSFDSGKFSGNPYAEKTASLIVSGIFPGENYLIVPASSSPMSSSCHTIQPDNSPASANPFFQIYCYPSNSMSAPTYPDDFYNDSHINDIYKDVRKIPIQSFCSITQSLIRASNTYPNSVVAFYQADGSLIASSLLPRPAHISDVAEPDSSPVKSSVIDIYTNGELLITNQPSYR